MTTQEKIGIVNEQWKRGSIVEKRILIAQDIIDRVRSEQYVPVIGQWGSVSMDLDPSVQHAIHKGNGCSCCAVGAAMASLIGFSNNASTVEWTYTLVVNPSHHDSEDTNPQRHALNRLLHRVFPTEQLQLIEFAYERGGGEVELMGGPKLRRLALDPERISDDFPVGLDCIETDTHDAETMWKALRFAARASHKNRMIAIMQNIIDNDGTFIP